MRLAEKRGKVMRACERFEDMSPKGKLKLLQQDDGDIIVVVIPDPDSRDKLFPSAEFCTHMGGGQSPNVLKALRGLMEAIERDNKETPQHRGK